MLIKLKINKAKGGRGFRVKSETKTMVEISSERFLNDFEMRTLVWFCGGTSILPEKNQRGEPNCINLKTSDHKFWGVELNKFYANREIASNLLVLTVHINNFDIFSVHVAYNKRRKKFVRRAF